MMKYFLLILLSVFFISCEVNYHYDDDECYYDQYGNIYCDDNNIDYHHYDYELYNLNDHNHTHYYYDNGSSYYEFEDADWYGYTPWGDDCYATYDYYLECDTILCLDDITQDWYQYDVVCY